MYKRQGKDSPSVFAGKNYRAVIGIIAHFPNADRSLDSGLIAVIMKSGIPSFCRFSKVVIAP